jgi:hypothetical protein
VVREHVQPHAKEEGPMITDLKINEENKKQYYEKGYWTEKSK